MKRLLLVSMVLITSLGIIGIPVGAASDEIVGRWSMDEGSGTIAYDSSGNDNHGTIAGDTHYVDGVSGTALSFDGNGDYVEIPGSYSMNFSRSYRLEASVYISDYDNNWKGIFRRGELYTSASEIEIYIQKESLDGKLTVAHNREGIDSCYRYFTPFPLNQWVHLVVTWEDGTLKVYYNGVEQEYTYGSSTFYSPTTSSPPKPNYIGVGYYQAYMDGAIDEVIVEGVSNYGIVGQCHLDEGSGATAYDSSGHENDGTIYGDTHYVDGVSGTALSFDGNGDYVEIPGSYSMNFGESYTVNARIYISNYDNHWKGIFRRGELYTSASEIEIYIQKESLDGKLTVAHNREGIDSCYRYFTPFPLNQWVHLVVTWEDGTLKVYYNGVEQEYTYGSSTFYSPTTSSPPKPNYIGVGYYQAYMDGAIDEVIIRDEARKNTPPKITELSVEPGELWPPNHKEAEVKIQVTAEDPDGSENIVSTKYSVIDEYSDYDVQETDIPANGIIYLVSDRDGKDKDGRIYTVTVTVYDAEGETDSMSKEVIVLHDQGKK